MDNLFELVESFFNILDSDLIKHNTETEALGEFLPLMQKGGINYKENIKKPEAAEIFNKVNDVFDFSSIAKEYHSKNKNDEFSKKDTFFETQKDLIEKSKIENAPCLELSSDDFNKNNPSKVLQSGSNTLFERMNNFDFENFEIEKDALKKTKTKNQKQNFLYLNNGEVVENPEYDKIGRYIAEKITEAVKDRSII